MEIQGIQSSEFLTLSLLLYGFVELREYAMIGTLRYFSTIELILSTITGNALKFLVRNIFLMSIVLFASGCTSVARFTSDPLARGVNVRTEKTQDAGRKSLDDAAQVNTMVYNETSSEEEESFDQGKASYYHDVFDGRKTASGERYDKDELTAAHRTLPFGTKVLVRNLRNNRSVIVRINDRGPFVGNRIIDLSEAAAEEIGMKHAGVVEVELRILN